MSLSPYSVLTICNLKIMNNEVEDDEMGGECSTDGYRLLVGKPEGRKPLGSPRRRWLDNIRIDFVEVGWGDVDWIGLT
jgi:hypothetical protein